MKRFIISMAALPLSAAIVVISDASGFACPFTTCWPLS
jgi:hypothetical protein